MARKYIKKTAKQKKEEINELTKDFLEKLDSYFISEEQLKEHLEFMGTFHKYSPRNMALIDKQFKGARAVDSFKSWKDKGVSVKKGEKGIKILVPAPVELFERNGKMIQKKYANAKEKQAIKQGTIETTKILHYKIGHVFEYTQTNAREKGLEVSDLFKQFHRDGTIENDKAMMNGLEKVAHHLDVEIMDTPLTELGTAKGVSYPSLKAVALNERNTDYENVGVLIHELAHAKLHTTETRNNFTQNEREFQAEMTSYVVASHYGIDTEEFSLSYLHGWTKNANMQEKEQLLKDVKNTASEFIGIIDESLEQELQQNLNREGDYNMDDKVNIKSFNREWSDQYELATITYTNGVTGKENDFSVWIATEDEQLTKEEFKSTSLDVFMSSPSYDFYIYDDIEEGISKNHFHTDLDSLIEIDEEIENTLIEYYNGDVDEFNIEIPKEKQNLDAKSVVVDEEITDVLLKSDMNALEVDDLVELGQTLENYNLDHFDFEFPPKTKEQLKGLEKNINNECSKNDKKLIKNAFDKLNFSNNIVPEPEKNISDEMIMER